MVHWNGSDASFSFKEYNKGLKNQKRNNTIVFFIGKNSFSKTKKINKE